jgi:hypothetical protein
MLGQTAKADALTAQVEAAKAAAAAAAAPPPPPAPAAAPIARPPPLSAAAGPATATAGPQPREELVELVPAFDARGMPLRSLQSGVEATLCE